MLILPLLYISAFFAAIKDIFHKNPQGGLLFLIFGLPIYNTSFSILHGAGFKSYIPLLQPFKETIILAMLGYILWNLKKKIRFHVIDYSVLAYLIYTGLYVLLPIGEFGFSTRLLAFKSTSFFGLIYYVGRIIDLESLQIRKYFHFILIVAISAALLVMFEVATDQHFQSLTGYTDYIYDFFGQEQEGNYGLTWTFERSESGLKRFASFFSDPLEHASATLLCLSVIAGLFTNKNNSFNPSKLGMFALIASIISITFSISRSSILSAFLIIYVYSIITNKKYILHGCHFLIFTVFVYWGYLVADKGVYEYIISTFTLQDASAAGHVIAWLEGLESMVSNPLGLGLGTSGRVAASLGSTVGGENQFIVLGVQVGVIAVMLYVFIHFTIIVTTYKWFPYLEGKERTVALTLLLLRIGISLPLFTANLDTYSYITYINWFLTGVFVNIIMNKQVPVDSAAVKSYGQ